MNGAVFHLIGEPRRGVRPEPVPVPPGVSRWDFSSGEPVRVPEESAGIVLEAVVLDNLPRLLLADPEAGGPIHRNDQLIGAVQLLSPGDQVRLRSGAAVEIARFHHPRIGKPAPEQAGGQCPVCLSPIEETQRVLTCPVCESVFHHETEEEKGEHALACALVIATCPRCQVPINLESGYQPEPEFLTP